MLITQPIGTYQAWQVFAGQPNPGYIGLGYFQSGLAR